MKEFGGKLNVTLLR